jgi:hypothetical protein
LFGAGYSSRDDDQNACRARASPNSHDRKL